MKLEDLVDFNPRTPVPKGESAPFVDMASLPTGDKHFPVSASRVFKGSGSKFKDGDTLLARITPCLENGKGGFVQGLGESVFAHGSTEFIVLRAKKVSDKDFTFYITKHPDFRAFAIKQMSGTSGRQRVAWQSLTDYELFDLRPEEREATGKLLSALDDKIELNRRMNATLEAMARALFRDWFVDFGPTRAKMAGDDPYLAPEIWSLFPDQLDEEGKPEGWETQSVIDQAEWINGAAYKNMHFTNAPDALPVVKIAELKAGVTPNTKWTNTALGEKYRITDGELLFSWSGNPDTSIDAFIWTGGPAWLNQHIFAVRDNDMRTPAFLYTMLKWLKPEFSEIARNKQTTGLGHVTKQDMKRMQIHVGSKGLLEQFENLVGPIFARLQSNLFETRTLAKTRDLLLPKLMSGEIRVCEAEDMVEDAG